VGKRENNTRYLWGNLKEEKGSEDVDKDGKIILKLILNE
jgi:hypothetical protein